MTLCHIPNRIGLVGLLVSAAAAVSLPRPTGPYGVGYAQHVFDHVTPVDPTPGSGKALLAHIYYPTTSTPCNDTTVPYFDPTSAAIWGEVFNIAPSDLLTLETALQWQAPVLSSKEANHVRQWPTLVFSPGGGVNAFMYSSLLSDLASQGYTVLALDHPGEPPYLALPDNEAGVVGWDIYMPYTDTQILQIYNLRRDDMLFFIAEGFPQLVEELGLYFNTDIFGAFGHSVGGAASIGSMNCLASIVGGMNIDGGLFGDSINASLTGRPFFMTMNPMHYAADPSWPGFVERYANEANESRKSWLDWTLVDGSAHLAFSDISLWVELLPKANGTNKIDLGNVTGIRMDAIQKEYIGAFWEFVRGGEYNEILDGEVPQWPEVLFNATVRGE